MDYKKILKIFVSTFLILICFSTSVFAEADKRFTLRVGYWPNYGITEDEYGNLMGYTYDYMHKIARINGWNVRFIPCDWDTGLKMLENGLIDVFGPLEKSSEREKIYDYPDMRMGEEDAAVFVRQDNNNIYYADPKSMDGKIIGTMQGNFYLDDLKQYCKNNNIDVKIKYISNANELEQAIRDGTVDMTMSGTMQFHENTKVVLRFAHGDFYYPTRKGNLFVLNGLNKALEQIQQENPYYYFDLHRKHYYKSPSEISAFNAIEAQYIKDTPSINVVYVDIDNPVLYYDNETRQVDGIAVDLMEKISECSGIKFKYLRAANVSKAQEMLNNNEAKLFLGVLGSGNFRDTYLMETTKQLMPSDILFVNGKRPEQRNNILAIPEGWIGIKHHIKLYYPYMTMMGYNNTRECLEAVLAGRANSAVISALSAANILKEQRYRDLNISSMSANDVNLHLGTTLTGSEILREVMNTSIGFLDSDTINEAIYAHTITVPYEPTFWDLIKFNMPILTLIMLLFFIVILSILSHSRVKLNKLAFYDPLTGEMNLNKFKIEAQKIMNRQDKQYAVMALDIDKFKAINDLYGYDFGDQVLKIVGKAMRESLLPGAMLCNGGADKFYVFFEFKDKLWMAEKFENMTNHVIDTVAKCLPRFHIILSCGICLIKPEDYNIISIIDRANIAGRQVKSYHESSFAYYDQAMYDRINQSRTIENSMIDSLKNSEFIVYLQPKISLTNNKIAGAEALIRWVDPLRGLIQPGEFIPLFEENGFIVNLDFYVLEQVCIILERWKKEGRELFAISVNLSRRHLFHADTAQRLYDIVSKYDVSTEYIEVELTESAFDNCDIPSICLLFDKLHTFGFNVSVDDFGAGYSSLSLLKDLPIDVLKIDKSFFDSWQEDESDKIVILLESIISLSRKLNIKTVSEGVETSEQVKLLMQLGCDLVQGFYFARPMPVWRLEERLDGGIPFGE